MTDRLQFGAFVLDLHARELRRGDIPVPLSPKAFQLLEILLAGDKTRLAASNAELVARVGRLCGG